jgi:hypothetical protein
MRYRQYFSSEKLSRGPLVVSSVEVSRRSEGLMVRNKRVIIVGATIIFGSIAMGLFFGRCSPGAREAHDFLSAVPADRILDIRLEPYAVSSLVSRDVVISDRAEIEKIAAQLRTARGISQNHPNARWVAYLRMTTADGDYGGQVESTTNQGLIVIYTSGVKGGWNYGAVRQDALVPILEEIVARAGARK